MQSRLSFKNLSACSLLFALSACMAVKKNTATAKDDTGGNTFTWTYSNHGWNALALAFDGATLKIDSPTGDETDDQRNVGPGFRPHVNYNRLTYQSGNDVTSFAKWGEASDFGISILCKRVADLLPEAEARFPNSDWPRLATAFHLAANATNATTCAAQTIAKPADRPGYPVGTTTPTNDLLCMASPQAETGQGPQLVTVWVPMVYSARQVRPWLNEWPQDQATLCVDGKFHTLARKDD